MYTTIYDLSPRSEEVCQSTPRPMAEGFINDKFPITKDEGHMFVVYTVIVMVHMIYICVLNSLAHRKITWILDLSLFGTKSTGMSTYNPALGCICRPRSHLSKMFQTT